MKHRRRSVVLEARLLGQCALLGALILSAGCPDKKSEAAPETESGEPGASDEHEGVPSRVRLSPAAVKAAKLKTAKAKKGVLAATLDLPGEVQSNPDKTAKVSPLVPGRIESVHFQEGQQLKKGALLVVIKVPELGKAKAAYAGTAAKAAAARANADRLKALGEKRLAANQEVVAAQAEAHALEVEAEAAKSQLHALGTGSQGAVGSMLTLRAPIDGVAVARSAVVGQHVIAEEVLGTIADLSDVWFLGRVFEKNLGDVHVGAPAEVELNAYPNERFSGKVEYLSKQIDPTARTVVARIVLQNRRDLLRLGLFGVARVKAHDGKPRAPQLIVPRTAVTDIGEKSVVFVKEPSGEYVMHEVVLGDGALGKVEIMNGLSEGEIIVTEGAFTLKSVLLRGTIGEED